MRRTNFDEIHAALDKLRELPFPPRPNNSALANWLTDLAELDGHYVGIAISVVNGKRISIRGYNDVIEKRNELSQLPITDGDKADYQSCKEYIEALENLVRSLPAVS